MLKEIVSVLSKVQSLERDGTIFCTGIMIDYQTKACIDFLDQQSVIENSDYENKIGETVNLELSVARLAVVGYYYKADSLIRKNKYLYPDTLFYVAELKSFSDEPNTEFYTSYKGIVNFINAIIGISKHNYTDVDINYALISNDDRALLLPLTYGISNINELPEDINHLQSIIDVFVDTNSEKQLLFINEMIDYLLPVTESERFNILLRTIGDFNDKCNNAYQYYLRDFSYNKLKIELDSKALDFTQKIQGVINDSQNKLVTIPTAFVLVFVAFDYNDLNSVKNMTAIIGLIIFAVLIQIFLNNQYSSLNFTEANITAYKETFSRSNIEKLSEKFSLVDYELKKQKGRLCLVTWILWLIPASLFLIWLTLYIKHPIPKK